MLVIGSGLSGLLHIQLASTLGAARVIATDVNDYRLKAAQQFGAEATIKAEEDVPARLRELNEGRLADLVIVCTGATSAISQALKSVDRGGTVLFFAPTDAGATVPLSINELFWRNDITLTTSYAGSPADYQAALEIIQMGTIPVREMITHHLSLAETELGFQLVANARDCLKVIIEPQR